MILIFSEEYSWLSRGWFKSQVNGNIFSDAYHIPQCFKNLQMQAMMGC